MTLFAARQPIRFTDLDKSRMKRRGLLNKHFCKKKIPNIPNETEKIVNFLFSHYKSMGTISCHSNQSSYPSGIKNTTFRSPTYRCYMWNMRRIGLTASEEMSFENVDENGPFLPDDGRTTDTFYTISSPMSLRLRWATLLNISVKKFQISLMRQKKSIFNLPLFPI